MLIEKQNKTHLLSCNKYGLHLSGLHIPKSVPIVQHSFICTYILKKFCRKRGYRGQKNNLFLNYLEMHVEDQYSEVQQSREKCIFKVLPSEMDPAEIRLLRQVIIKGRGAEGFQKNPPAPHPPRALQSIILTPPCFLISNYTTIQIAAENINGALVVNLFFSFRKLQS